MVGVRPYCPGCEPAVDPCRDMVVVRWGESHAPSRDSLDDALVIPTHLFISDDAGGDDNRRWWSCYTCSLADGAMTHLTAAKVRRLDRERGVIVVGPHEFRASPGAIARGRRPGHGRGSHLRGAQGTALGDRGVAVTILAPPGQRGPGGEEHKKHEHHNREIQAALDGDHLCLTRRAPTANIGVPDLAPLTAAAAPCPLRVTAADIREAARQDHDAGHATPWVPHATSVKGNRGDYQRGGEGAALTP